MSEEKKSAFKVVDRRRFTDEGEQRAGADVPQDDGGVTFSTFLQSLAQQGLMQMGLVPWPDGQRALAIEQARETVELVELLKAKTRGNLTAAEHQVMNAVVHELTFRFAYADRRLPGDEATEQADVGSDAQIAVTYLFDGAVDEDAVVRCIAAVAQAMHRPMPQRHGDEACWFADGRPVAQLGFDPDTGPSLGIVAELALKDLDAIVASTLNIRDRDALAAAALRAPQALPAAALANRHDPSKALLFAIVDALEGPAATVEAGLKAVAWLEHPAFGPALEAVTQRAELSSQLRSAANWLLTR